jgi:hypothetical protein
VPAVNGGCTSGYVFAKKTGKCHRPCPTLPAGTDCKNNGKFCVKCEGQKLCTETREQCK